MSSFSSTLDPLASYLEPRFGHIYSIDSWTPELAAAVIDYLIHEMSEEDYNALLRLVNGLPNGSREEAAKFITRHWEPWEVATASHRLAVRKLLDLKQLVNLLSESMPDGPFTEVFEYGEVRDWLLANTTYERLRALWGRLGDIGPIPAEGSDWWHIEFEYWLQDHVTSAQQLLEAWRDISPFSELYPRPTPIHRSSGHGR